MSTIKRRLAVGAGAALVVAGGGAAIAATQSSPQAESQAVVNDAAKQLGVDPAKLGAALKQALANRVDAAVKAGRLTEAQGTALKERIQAGGVPFLGVPGFGGPRGLAGPGDHRSGYQRGGHHRGGHLDAAATYLGITKAALRASLGSGKTLAQVAKAEGKSVEGLVDALVADETKELDAAVAAGRLTKEQRDEIVSRLEERLTARVNGEHPAGGPGFGRGFGSGHGPSGPPSGGSSEDGSPPVTPEAA